MINPNLSVLKKLLKKNNYHVDDSKIELRLLSHPNFPHINSITDTLDELNVENFAVEFPTRNIDQIENCFLALIKQDNKDFCILVEKQKNKKVMLFGGEDTNNGEIVDEDYFLALWTGIAILLEQNEDRNFISINKIMLLVLASSLFTLPIVRHLNIAGSAHYFLSFLGSIISFFIFLKQAGYQSKLTDRFCTDSKSSNCELVLNEIKLRLPLKLKLGDYALIYFVALMISTLFISSAEQQNYLFKFLGILSVPVIILSIGYQLFIMGKYCKLCLLISAVLSLQLLLCFLLVAETAPAASILSFPLLFVIFTICLFFLKQELLKAITFRTVNISNQKFKRDYELFLAYHERQAKIQSNLPAETDEINLGNPEAPLHFIVVTNPMCVACDVAHTIYTGLLKKYPDEIRVTLRFFVPIDQANDPRTVIAAYFLYLQKTINSEDFLKKLEFWTNKKVLIELSKDLNNESRKEFYDFLKIHRSWCEKNNIYTTPFLIINERPFPEIFDIQDVENFIHPLVENLRQVGNEYMQ